MSKKTFILLLIITIAAFLAVRLSFNLAQGGDDWGIHYLIWGIFDVRHEAVYWNPFTYFCTYCPHYFFLSIISRFFGYEHIYYFLASFIARVIAASAIFFLIKKLTGRILPAILAGIFFAVTYLGIEATDWAFNYNYYLGIAVVCLLLDWYWKAKITGKFKHTLIACLLVAASAIISPARMHGLIPLLLIVELGWWAIDGKKYNFKKGILRLLIASIFYYIVLYGISDLYIFIRDTFHFEIGPFYIGNGYGAKEWNSGRVYEGINFIKTKIAQGQPDLIIDPIATLGNYIMPDRLWEKIPFSQISFFGNLPFTFLTYFLPISLVYGFSTYVILKLVGLKKHLTPLYAFCLILWLIFIYLLHQISLNTFFYPRIAFSLIGGFSIIFSIWAFCLLKTTKPILAHLLLVGLGWMFTFILFPWIIGPYGIILTWGRYSIQQGAGLAIWMAVIFTLAIDILQSKRKFSSLGIIYLVISFFILMHLNFANDYLNYVNTYRNKEIDAKFWNQITSTVPTLDNKGLNIFLLITDQTSAEIAEAIRFGFYGRASIYYKTTVWEYSPFMVINNYDDILSSVYDGKYLLKQGRKPIPTSIDRIYAFYFQNKEMYNITEEVRKKLTEDVATLKKGNQLPLQTTP